MSGFTMLRTRSSRTPKHQRMCHISAQLLTFRKMLLVVVLELLVISVLAQPSTLSRQEKCGRVHITISSLSDAYVELNWITNCSNVQPAVISLFNKDPASREELYPLASIQASNYPTGFFRTRVKFKAPILPGNWEYRDDLTRTDPGKHCFPYWIVSFAEDGTIIDSQCFAIQPTWMADNKERLLQKTLDSILIPGTHNSGAYDGSQLPKWLQNYILNQDRLIWTQLVFGIRYLDLRVAYYRTQGFYLNHDKIQITPLRPLLRQIRKFMELSEEIVVVDFHRFPYPSDFGEELHAELTNMIYEELGEFALPRLGYSEKLDFGTLWNTNKRLIISYNNFNTIKERPWLWNGITQYWANTVDVTFLKNYLWNRIMANSGGTRLWALMAELTPRITDIFLLKNNLRQLADDVNRELTIWFRDEWKNFSYNIVATDYFLGNDLINVAIEEIR